MKWGFSVTAANNTTSNKAQEWIHSAVMNPMRKYRTYLLYQDLLWLITRFYTYAFPPKTNSVSGHNCAQIFTDGEEFVWIMPFFSKDEVGMELRSFTRRLGIPNELHFDGADEQMGYHRNFQYDIREFRIEWRNSESCSPWQNRANNLIIIIKEEWKQRTVLRRILKNFWSFGLAWEAEIYSHTL